MKTRSLLTLAASLLLMACAAQAHAFPDHAEPKVGSTVQLAPTQVKVWFTEKLVGPFSNLQVFDATGKEIDKHDKQVDKSNPALLLVSVPPLKAGKYKVIWKAVSVDTHTTQGDFTFDVTP